MSRRAGAIACLEAGRGTVKRVPRRALKLCPIRPLCAGARAGFARPGSNPAAIDPRGC